MPKICLISWVWNLALFWQLISCYEPSSCHKKILIPKNYLGIANLIVCHKSVWLVEFEISPFLTTHQLLRAVKLSEKNFDFRNCLMVYGSSFVPNLSSFARLHQTIPVGWLVGGWLVGWTGWMGNNASSFSLVFGAWQLKLSTDHLSFIKLVQVKYLDLFLFIFYLFS